MLGARHGTHDGPSCVTVERRRRPAAVLRALLVPLLVLLGLAPAGHASAASSRGSTTGTASTVSPSTIALGGTLTYTLSGFPAGAQVDVLVDDGTLAQAEGSSQPVVESLTVSEDGTAQGSFELPTYVAEGSHWLRFRASGGPDVPMQTTPTRDYTNRSPFFTVGEVTVIGGTSTAPAAGEPSQAATSGTISGPVPGGSESTAPQIIEVPSGYAPITQGASATEVGRSGFPVVGMSVLALGVGTVAMAVVIVIRRRRSSYAG